MQYWAQLTEKLASITVKVLDIQDSANELYVLTGVGVSWVCAKTLTDSWSTYLLTSLRVATSEGRDQQRLDRRW